MPWCQKWVGTGTRRMPAADEERRLKGGSDGKGSSSAGPTEAAEGATLVTSPPQLWPVLARFWQFWQFWPPGDQIELLLVLPPVVA